MANRRKKTFVEINDVPFGARLEFPAVDLARPHGIHLMGFYLKLLKINGVRPSPLNKQHDLIKSVPVRELNIRVGLYKITDPGNQKFSDTLISAEQITNTVCWNFLCHSKTQKVGRVFKYPEALFLWTFEHPTLSESASYAGYAVPRSILFQYNHGKTCLFS